VRSSFRRRGRGIAALAVALAAAAAPLAAGPLLARAQVGGASPASGSLSGNGSSTTWQFDPVIGAGQGSTPIEVECVPVQCARFDLNVSLPQPPEVFYKHYIATLTFHCSWAASPAPDDVDCFMFSPTQGETGPGAPDDTTHPFEDLSVVDPQPGDWSFRADAGVAPVPNFVTGKATLSWVPAIHPGVQTRLSTDQQFTNYDFPVSYQTRDGANRPNAGEPSLGIDWSTGAVMYMAGNQVTRLTYNDANPPVPAPTNVTPPNSFVNEDAILFTDRDTNRTWALGLLLAGSYLAFSDQDGAPGSWTPSVAITPPAMPDHESLGAGPYSTHVPEPSHSYPHAVYYCAQTEVQDAYCGRSDDGGLHFNVPASPVFGTKCSPLHGHVRVGPTGIVYVPNSRCSDTVNGQSVGRSGVAVSVDDGASFQVSMPPDSSPGGSDPSVMEGPDGTVYFGYQASNGHPMIATATHDADGNLKWAPSVDVGQFQNPGEAEDGLTLGVQNTEFPEVITGSRGRAAFAFLGTGLPGDDQVGDYQGTWYLYVSYTYDGGKHWRTVNATPDDPVQRGCVWNGGLINACRNLLDFNDIGIDKQGRVYVAYTDGCTTIIGGYSCDHTPGIHGWNNAYSGDTQNGCPLSELDMTITSTASCTFARVSAIVRQTCGRGLIAAYDNTPADPRDCVTASSGVSGSFSSSETIRAPRAVPGTLPNTSGGGAPAWPAGALVVGLAGGAVASVRRRRRS
jgi:hypothetical protein